jgi:hypothetical protein
MTDQHFDAYKLIRISREKFIQKLQMKVGDNFRVKKLVF